MAESAAGTVFHFGGFRLDLTRGCLLDTSGLELALRPKSFDLLSCFVQNAARLLSREELLDAVCQTSL